MEQFEDDGTWVWVAFDPEHKVALAHVVGERKQPSANKLLKQVKERVVGIPSFCSDGLKFYTNAILKFYGHKSRSPGPACVAGRRCQQSFRMTASVMPRLLNITGTDIWWK
jgi:transposase-like protein